MHSGSLSAPQRESAIFQEQGLFSLAQGQMQTVGCLAQALWVPGLWRLTISFTNDQSIHLFAAQLLLLDLCYTSNSDSGAFVKLLRTLKSLTFTVTSSWLIWATALPLSTIHPYASFHFFIFISYLFFFQGLLKCLCSFIFIIRKVFPFFISLQFNGVSGCGKEKYMYLIYHLEPEEKYMY